MNLSRVNKQQVTWRRLSNDLLADSHEILIRCMNYSSQILNVHNIIDVRQTETPVAEPFAPDPSLLVLKLLLQN
jgi:hypothetical protein